MCIRDREKLEKICPDTWHFVAEAPHNFWKSIVVYDDVDKRSGCLLYTSPSPRD